MTNKQVGWQWCIVEDGRVAKIQSDKQVGWQWCIVEDGRVEKIQSDRANQEWRTSRKVIGRK